jgi:hypothetical protein
MHGGTTGVLRVAGILVLLSSFLMCWPKKGICQETESQALEPAAVLPEEVPAASDEPARRCPVEALMERWYDWPPSQNFRITLEYRNYTYLEGEARGDSRDSINEGRLRIEYDKRLRENIRLYLNLLAQADDDDFTHGFFDLDEDNLKRSYVNFTEAFVDFYFSAFDVRLGEQIINWGVADIFNPTGNVTPTDYSNLLDEDDMGIPAANVNFYWKNWNLQVVGIPLFAPSRLPPRGTRFSIYPPDSPVPIENPELPPNTLENAQFGTRLRTTWKGWDFSVSYYDGINDIPSPELRFNFTPFPMPYVVPVYNRMRVFGADFATVFDRWGLHGEAAQFIFDSDRQDDYFEYVLGFDYTRANILFNHDVFMIVEYVGLEVTDEGNELETETPPLDRILTNAITTNTRYEFTDYTWLEIRAAYDFDQHDYYIQPQLAHSVNDNLTVILGLDLLGGPLDTFLGQFRENDRVYAKLIYVF